MRAAKKSWRQGQAVSTGAAVSETCFGAGHGTNQWYFSLQIFSIFTSVHSTHLGPTNCFSPLSGLWGGQEGLKENEGATPGIYCNTQHWKTCSCLLPASRRRRALRAAEHTPPHPRGRTPSPSSFARVQRWGPQASLPPQRSAE